MVRTVVSATLVLVVTACSSKEESQPEKAPAPTAEQIAKPSLPAERPHPPVDAAPAPDAKRAGAQQALGFHFSVTVPEGWTIAPPDPVLPGKVMLRHDDHDSATIARMVQVPATATKDIKECREAAERLTETDLKLESAAIVKGTRYGAACRIVHHDAVTRQRLVSELFAVGEHDTLYFMCWSDDARRESSPECKAIFDSIKLDD